MLAFLLLFDNTFLYRSQPESASNKRAGLMVF